MAVETQAPQRSPGEQSRIDSIPVSPRHAKEEEERILPDMPRKGADYRRWAMKSTGRHHRREVAPKVPDIEEIFAIPAIPPKKRNAGLPQRRVSSPVQNSLAGRQLNPNDIATIRQSLAAEREKLSAPQSEKPSLRERLAAAFKRPTR